MIQGATAPPSGSVAVKYLKTLRLTRHHSWIKNGRHDAVFLRFVTSVSQAAFEHPRPSPPLRADHLSRLARVHRGGRSQRSQALNKWSCGWIIQPVVSLPRECRHQYRGLRKCVCALWRRPLPANRAGGSRSDSGVRASGGDGWSREVIIFSTASFNSFSPPGRVRSGPDRKDASAGMGALQSAPTHQEYVGLAEKTGCELASLHFCNSNAFKRLYFQLGHGGGKET